ncbi:MAG: cupin domain-containing protein [bacterium]|nr:cupin domain-containing protein [bacterium]
MLPKPVIVPGERIFEFVTAADDQPYGIALVEVQESQPHWHNHTRECYLLVRGCVEVFLDGEPTMLEHFGDRVVIPPGVPHWARAVGGGGQPAIVTVISKPAWTPEDHHVVTPK